MRKPRRLIEGVKTAVSHFQRVMSKILNTSAGTEYTPSTILMDGINIPVQHHESWLDDVLLHETSEKQYLLLLKEKLLT